MGIQALVSQHLENISRRALHKYQGIIRSYVQSRHGVYALYRGPSLYYVGLARDLRNRFHTHLRDRHGNSWDRFSVYLTVRDSHIRELESLVVRIVEPSGNRQIGQFARADDLCIRFKKDIRDLQRIELSELMERRPRSNGRSKAKKRRRPVLQQYVTGQMVLKAKLRGRPILAKVLKGGLIEFKGKLYNSPSMAATAACGHYQNGWLFWRFEKTPGNWVPLKTLRT